MKDKSIVKLQSAKARKICQKINDFTLLKRCTNTLLFSITSCSVLFLLLVLSVSISYHLALAQGGAITQNGQQPMVSQGNATAGALLEKVSDKGNYRVQVMWNESSLFLSKKGFDMEIDFLNASAPLPTTNTVPQKESNLKGESSLGSSRPSVPASIQPTVPVDSYDITIYSNQGKVLWKKLNQPVTGGRGLERVALANGYIGDITIQITNIKSGSIPPNSVTFTARVVG
ncbi:MAG TPA: hypothetical protein VE076_08915 [Nitrososphaeraceae archaeon]|nr:hypothetical protein [Nitrososphaeraceae archaeon]